MSEILRPIILGVDDETPILEAFHNIFKDEYEVALAADGEEALKKVRELDVKVVLLDITIPKVHGFDVLRKIKEIEDNIEVIIVTASDDVEDAVEAMKLGALHYIVKPFRIDELKLFVKKAFEKRALSIELNHFRSQEERWIGFTKIISKSNLMRPVFETVNEVSRHNATVLIYGETGTGKELIARAIHYKSHRRGMPFVAVDCVALTETLIESELFGHERGAFTGATFCKLGKFELAHGGTLFLDEIGNLKTDIQAKLLRTIQEKVIQRVGGVKNIQVDIRIISASNIDLKKAVEKGTFREDLFYRLNVVPIYLPPLKDRVEDIPHLINYFLGYYSKEFKKNISGLTKETIQLLMDYSWPGNVRELENVIERLAVLAKDGEEITLEKLPSEITQHVVERGFMLKDEIKTPQRSFKEAREEFEKQYIKRSLERHGWILKDTAEDLKIHRNDLRYLMNKLGVEPPTGTFHDGEEKNEVKDEAH